MEYNSFWFSILIAIGIVFISLTIFFTIWTVLGAIDNNGNIVPDKPVELKCLKFSDGRLAIIKHQCTGEYETISWFINKGYHIAHITDGEYSSYEVYMSR